MSLSTQVYNGYPEEFISSNVLSDVKGDSHRNYVELRVVLRTDYAELILPYAVPRWQYAEGRKRVREMDANKLNMFSTQFLRKSTQLYATVRHAYAIVRYCVQ